jgi:VIT1/CCC1 family predicted Fe2+/Mn2+ transporter
MISSHKHEPHDGRAGEYLRDLIYGAIDGTVTTFAVVAGVAGAALSPTIVLILGFANLFADGFSMAVSNFLSIHAEKEYIEREHERENWEVDNMPDTERAEVRDILAQKGFASDQLDAAVAAITSNKKYWVDMMMSDELGLNRINTDPKKHALATFSAFVLAGVIPLLAYILSYFFTYFREHAFIISIVLTSVTFFIVGAAKTHITKKSAIIGGLETLFVGGIAAFVAYYVGVFLKYIIG